MAPRGEVHRFFLDGREHVIALSPGGDGPAEAALTAAEHAVAKDIVRGCSNAAIAARRGVSARTVANQVASILSKLGVRSRLELVARLTSRRR